MKPPYDYRWDQGRKWALQLYKDNGPLLDVGCGRRPCHSRAVTVDAYRGPDGGYPSEIIDPHFYQSYMDLPFKDNTFTQVVSIDSVEHTEDPVAAIDEWLRVLKPGGYLSLLVPDHMFTPQIDDHPVEWTLESFRKGPIDTILDAYDIIGSDGSGPVYIRKSELVENWWAGFILQKFYPGIS